MMRSLSFNELLSILELEYFPTEEALKKHYKNLLKKYHPDTCKLKKAHERTIEIKQAFELLSANYKYYYQQYINCISNKSQKPKELLKLLVYYNNKFYLGLPLYGLKTFLSKEDAHIVYKNFHYYVKFNNNFYKVLMLETIKDPLVMNYYYFVIYELEEYFALYLLDKLKFIETIETENKIIWNDNFGKLEYFSMTILIPAIFKKILTVYSDAMYTYK